MNLTLDGTFTDTASTAAVWVHVGLTLAHGRFTLNVDYGAPFSIRWGTAMQGTYVTADDKVVLEARERRSYQSETVEKESAGPVARTIEATFAGPASTRTAALELRIDDWPFPILLIRSDGLASEVRASLEAERDRRRAEWEAQQAKRDAEAGHQRSASIAGKAFKDRDYKRVIELLEPLEARLTPSEHKKLEYARKHV